MLASQTPAHLWMLSGGASSGASRAEESYERCLCSGSEQHTEEVAHVLKTSSRAFYFL